MLRNPESTSVSHAQIFPRTLVIVNERSLAGFRALIEENVKTSVRRIATNPVIVNV